MSDDLPIGRAVAYDIEDALEEDDDLDVERKRWRKAKRHAPKRNSLACSLSYRF